jgi:hypothetical protein
VLERIQLGSPNIGPKIKFPVPFQIALLLHNVFVARGFFDELFVVFKNLRVLWFFGKKVKISLQTFNSVKFFYGKKEFFENFSVKI